MENHDLTQLKNQYKDKVLEYRATLSRLKELVLEKREMRVKIKAQKTLG